MMNVPYINGPLAGLLFGLFIIWSVVWKGMALWKAGRRNELGWFIALLLINTVGILEIIYLFIFAKKEKRSK